MDDKNLNAAWNPKAIEEKWRKLWLEQGVYEPDIKAAKNPFYNLMMFPYPSGEGLHTGHAFAFTGADIYGRYKKMRGLDLFEPIGFDSFGIHSENYALKIGKHPRDLIAKTTDRYEEQMKSLGIAYSWNHKLATSDIDYYKWTQWIFVQLFKNGLAYRGKANVNWCPQCLTVLADEQVIKKQKGTGEVAVCERCDTEVERRELSQWFFRITKYAQKLLDNLEKIDWSEKVKVAQRNWLGKSQGAKLMFHSDIESNALIEVFTTRPDTIFGVTFMVLAPEHPLVTKIINKANGPIQQQIRDFVDYSLKKTEQERIGAKIEAKNSVKNKSNQEKTGIFSGFFAINPLNSEKIPIYIADYVLMTYGTGAVMGVPAHDERDFQFAKRYKLDIKPVILPKEGKWDFSQSAFTGEGTLANSGQFDGLTTEEGIQSVINYIKKHQLGSAFTTWHLRDWIISRQRYWGPPIPMIYCEKCAKEGKSWFTEAGSASESGPAAPYPRPTSSLQANLETRSSLPSAAAGARRGAPTRVTRFDLNWEHAGWYPVDEEDLPVELPYVKNFKPTGTGVSPLAADSNFVNVKCPGCGAEAKRETDVSDTFLDSAWYFLRYPSVDLSGSASKDSLPWDPEITKKWLPVDMYIGGAEHSVLHLLYSRFVTMALCDMGFLDFEEPFPKFRAHGLVIKDGAKMSKSRGNVVVPDDYIAKFGADALRCYLMFCGRFSQGGDFRDTGIEGMQRFLKRVWRLVISGPVSTFLPASAQSGQKTKGDQLKDADLRAVGSPSSTATRESMRMMHKTIKKVTQDIESLDYNTAIAALMEWVNFLEAESGPVGVQEIRALLLLLAPFAPFMTEELWQRFFAKSKGKFESVHVQRWPEFDENKIKSGKTLLVVQVDGKMRDRVEVEVGLSKEAAEGIASKSEKVSKYLQKGKYRTIYVPDRLINFVTE